MALAFGLLTLFGPEKSIAWFAPLMLFYAMADGVLAIAAAARAAYARERWACLLVEGIAGVTGIVLIAVWPEVTIPELSWSIAGWATVSAIGAIVTAGTLGKRATRDWLLAAGGAVLLRFAVLAIGAIRASEFAIAFWCGAGAVVFTALLLTRMLQMRLASGRGVPAGRSQLFAR